MKRSQQGFTLIELVVVIVLLGIVGAVATARFQDLSGEALAAAQQGIAAEIQSSSAINYAKEAVDSAGTFTPITVDGTVTCAVAAGNLLTAGVPSGWTVNADAITGCGAPGNTTNNCTIVDDDATLGTLSINMICTG
jgi:MSHA pilin protein MshA